MKPFRRKRSTQHSAEVTQPANSTWELRKELEQNQRAYWTIVADAQCMVNDDTIRQKK